MHLRGPFAAIIRSQHLCPISDGFRQDTESSLSLRHGARLMYCKRPETMPGDALAITSKHESLFFDIGRHDVTLG
jgi:hypothetical protein